MKDNGKISTRKIMGKILKDDKEYKTLSLMSRQKKNLSGKERPGLSHRKIPAEIIGLIAQKKLEKNLQIENMEKNGVDDYSIFAYAAVIGHMKYIEKYAIKTVNDFEYYKDLIDERLQTVFKCAAENGRVEVIEFLVEFYQDRYSSDVFWITSRSSDGPSSLSISYRKKFILNVEKIIDEYGDEKLRHELSMYFSTKSL